MRHDGLGIFKIAQQPSQPHPDIWFEVSWLEPAVYEIWGTIEPNEVVPSDDQESDS